MTRSLAIIALLLAACARDQVVAILPVTPGDAGVADAGNDASTFCEGRGPPIILGDTETCGGELAGRTFRFALCTCADLALSNTLVTDAFDSTEGPYTAGDVGGSVGTVGRADVNAPLRIGGSLWVGSSGGLTAAASAPIDLGADLASAGPVESSARITAAGDARVNGRLAAAELTIGGTLTLPEAAPLDVAGPTSTGALVRAPVDVAPPCACEPDGLYDIAAYVARHETANDNAAVNLAPDALAAVTSTRTLELPCGRFYLERVATQAELHLSVTGRAAVFVAGDLALEAPFHVDLAPDAELDLFVAGNIVASRPIHFGSAATPARARLYTGGAGTLQLSAGGRFSGNLYGPRAELVASAPIEVFGSVFVRRVSASAGLTIHYDTAVLGSGDCGG